MVASNVVWSSLRLGELGTLVRGVSYNPDDTSTTAYDGYIPVLRATNIQNGKLELQNDLVYVNPKKVAPDQLLQVGDIVIAMSSGSKSIVGKAAQLNTEWKGAFGAFCAVFRANPSKIDVSFLAYIFQTDTYRSIIAKLSRGTNINNLSKNHILNYDFLLPSLFEQRAISYVLLTVQQARETRLHEIALERERKAALMEHLFTHGTRVEATKQTEIGEMPESWKVVKLGNLLRERLRNGHSARASNSKEGIRTLTLTAVTKNDFSINNTKITIADPTNVKDLWLEPGDVFVERANTPEFVGLAALYEGSKDFAIYPDLMIRVRLRKDEADPKFLVEFLLTEQCRNYFMRNAASTTGNMPKIDHGVIERTLIPFPKDFLEQLFMADIFRSCDTKIAALEHEAHLLNELFRTMLEKLMSGRFSTNGLVFEDHNKVIR